METQFSEIYAILSNVSKLSLNEYQDLIFMYGEDNVNKVIEYLALEDEENIYKFDVYFSSMIDSLDEVSDLSNYSIYLSDIKEIACLDSDKNMVLMGIAYQYIQEMEEIFKEIGCDDTILGKNRVPWIADKVEYCLNNCKNKKILDRLKSLYNNYCNVRDKIVSGNLRLVIKFASEYSDDLSLIDDMIQYGNMGLIRAVEKFNINKDVTFNTYAGYWIMQSMSRGIKTIKYPMRLPMNIIYMNSKLMDARNNLSLQLGRNATDIELSKFMNINLKKMGVILLYFGNNVSLDEIVKSNFDDKEDIRGELVQDDRVDVFNDAVGYEYKRQLLEFLSKFLTEKEFMILKLYFGLNMDETSYTQGEIAKMLGISQQNVWQIKKNALLKLRRKPSVRDIVIV